MQNYTESKKVLDKIAAKYSCAGNLIMKVAFQDLLRMDKKHSKMKKRSLRK